MQIVFTAIPTALARHYLRGGPDAYGNPPERGFSDGAGNPCRHCLTFIPEGEEMLVLAHCPFPERQPYAETGPIFLCADACTRWRGRGRPPILSANGGAKLVKGYSDRDRIVYGLGRIAALPAIEDAAAAVLADPRVAYVHLRSATNNCFTCRVERG